MESLNNQTFHNDDVTVASRQDGLVLRSIPPTTPLILSVKPQPICESEGEKQ